MTNSQADQQVTPDQRSYAALRIPASRQYLLCAALAMMAEAELSVVVLLLAIAAIYLLLGMFLDPIGIMVLTLPLMIPLVESYDMNLIWFGVVVIKLLEIGLITPPVGLNVFVIANVVGKEAPIDKIFAGITRFLSVDVIVLVLIMSFPMISLLIPMAAR